MMPIKKSPSCLQGDLKEKQREKELAEEENFGPSTWGIVRAWIWNVMEYPWTSKTAQVNLLIFSAKLSEPRAYALVTPSGLTSFRNENKSYR